MSSDQSLVPIDLTQDSSEDDYEAAEINEKVRNALSLNAWHTVLQASCKFITGVLADVSSGRKLLHIVNPYKHLFLKSTQDLKNLEPLQPSVYSEVIPNSGQWIPRFKFENRLAMDAPALTEDMKISILEQQLTLIIHASRCEKRQNESMRVSEYATAWPKCYSDVPYCHMMRSIFQHINKCRIQPGTCTFGFCEPSKRIISHFKNCPDPKCSLCTRVSCLIPAKPRVRRNAIDDVDVETYLARVAPPRTPPRRARPASVAPVPANLFAFPTYSGFRLIPGYNEVYERIEDNVPLDEPIVTLNDNETL